ncbi:golgi-specific brefeldin A-resistance guanine nucleotide exchange factor 1 [Geosmithia morbida]|uniref:Golgi-specific brefeldin A-resistance guanine nucleotide exchange factor 1 n=1 Tax=Geosmithia morbida TaxID=1094350 RepID=A0A9P4YYP6_9HYPO|nr:golgi-specific brefeldin A-resistance guanine nucleotide exchange factor 1 [Geosmithia morbida]KAF4125340.1 golgi-specific brefeldin A-resistance guanine nucleotide exchange factor 1 [Geosmithia morbida]
MNRDALASGTMDSSQPLASSSSSTVLDTPRMQYRSRPVSVAVDPVSLIISECISITSAIQKHARSQHSSVSAILGGNPNPLQLGPPSPSLTGRSKSPLGLGLDGDSDAAFGNRWGLRGQRGRSMQDNPMIAGFGKLRHEIAGSKDVRTFDAPSLLAPFLHVMQAKGTAAPITILALGALRKFLAYGFVSPESPRFALAMQSLSAAVTHCQFDISDSGQVEVVLLMILNLMEDMMSGPGGDILSDESVCDMMGRGLAICSQPRFSPVLRRTAEAAMVRMCQIIFEDVKHIEVEAGPESTALDQQVQGAMGHVRMETNNSEVLKTPEAETKDSESTKGSDNGGEEGEKEEKSEEAEGEPTKVARQKKETTEVTEDTESLDLKPYSLPSVRELFRVLVNFLDPHDRQHTDTMRVMAMRIIHVALEVAGPFIARHPALASIAEDRLCCYLFQLVRSDNMAILQESLIVAGTLLTTCRPVLKLQQELFLSYLVACLHPTVEIPREPGIDPSLYSGIPQTPKLVKPPSTPTQQPASGRSTPVPVKDRQKLGLEGGSRKPDARQAMVEGIGVLSRMPTFMVELFVNYDCDVDRADLCEDTVGLLTRNALPDSATWSTTSVPPLCLDALLRYIQFIAERLDNEPVSEGYPDPAHLREERRKKRVIIQGTTKFNEKPMAGLGFLEAQGIIKDARDPVEVATFLNGTSRVSKAVLGDFLSKRGNEAILSAFLDLFDFSGKRVDEALRLLLEAFRLPGEAPLIATIVEVFSEKYIDGANPPEVSDKDAAFILTYAIILLNTDQHNPNLKDHKRMTLDDFSRNLRGQNARENFAPEYLQEIYETIKSDEIILPDEHDNKHAFDYAWRELLQKTESAGELVVCDTNIYDADMFAATWRPIVSTLSYVFMSATDDAVFARIVTGFDECARIASKYGNKEALDQIIYCLSHMTTLGTDVRLNTALNTEVQVGEGSVMVSELAVKLGRDFRAQLATLVLFRVVTNNEALVTKGWNDIVRIWVNLFVNSLTPPFSPPELPDLGIPPIPLQSPSQVIDRATRSTETGFFSAFTSYISSYAADDPPEPSDEELESTLCTVDCVKSCKIDKVFSNIAKLPTSSLSGLVEALLEQLPENKQEPVISVKQEDMPSPHPSGRDRPSESLEYDPVVAFLLEFATKLATRDKDAVEAVGKRDHDFANVPYLLHSISTLSQSVLSKAAELTLAGIATCIDQPGSLRNELMTSPDFWKLLQKLARDPESAAKVFGILERGTSGSPPAIMADNYEAAIALLDDFASAASPLKSQEPQAAPKRADQPKKQANKDYDAIVRGCKAIEILQNMTGRIPQLIEQSHLEASEGWLCPELPHTCPRRLTDFVFFTAWSAYWLPVFQALTAQCTNPCREVRQLAFSSLQRSLLLPELTSNDPQEWTAIFGSVLFPLIQRLLKPEVFSTDRDGMGEMRVQAASLLCKVFLQYLVLLSEWEGMLDLWIKIVEIMDRLKNSGQGDSLEEAVWENLKNVVLFMASSGYLVSPKQDPSKEQLWTETWKRIDRFLPDLRSDLALEGEEEVEETGKKQEGKKEEKGEEKKADDVDTKEEAKEAS